MHYNEENNVSEEIESLREEIARLQNSQKPGIGSQIKEALGQAILNSVQDIPSTLTGVGFAGALVVAQWPNVDTQTIIEAVGFGSFGAISNNKKNNEFG